MICANVTRGLKWAMRLAVVRNCHDVAAPKVFGGASDALPWGGEVL
jgi:hypothetical protein